MAGWGSGGRETPCGRGSTLAATERIRPMLRDLFDRYEVRTVADAGAGDLNWIRRVDLRGIDYWPFDLVVRHPDVTEFDVLAEVLPPCDLILCRTVLNHLRVEQVEVALRQFRRSHSTYLLATTFPEGGKNWVDFTAYDLRAFGLGEPLESHPDDPGELALWRL